jgi:hypothetical protein
MQIASYKFSFEADDLAIQDLRRARSGL